MRFLKKFLIGIYIFLAIFAVAALVIFAFTGMEPATLLGCVFGVVSAESIIGFLIKAFCEKDDKHETDNDNDDKHHKE